MSYISSNLLSCVRSPLIIAKRYRAKINIQKPKQPHYERAKILAVTTPIYQKNNVKKMCFEQKYNKEKLNPYDDIIAKDVLDWLNKSKMIAIYHMNSMSKDDIFNLTVALRKNNMYLKSYGKKIIGKAVENTKYQAIHQLFHTNNYIVFSSEENVIQLLKLTKKYQQIILLAGVIQNRLLNRNEFVQFAHLPDLQTMRSQFVGVMNMAVNQLVNNLESQQKHFVNILDVYTKYEKKSRGDNKSISQ